MLAPHYVTSTLAWPCSTASSGVVNQWTAARVHECLDALMYRPQIGLVPQDPLLGTPLS